jgi:osmotically-inducible protein OsmY
VVASARPKLEMTLPDSAIRQKLLSELKRQSWAHTHNLGVTVTNGVVDLWGYVQSDEERKAIRVAAEDIPGVIAVNDHLADSPILAY